MLRGLPLPLRRPGPADRQGGRFRPDAVRMGRPAAAAGEPRRADQHLCVRTGQLPAAGAHRWCRSIGAGASGRGAGAGREDPRGDPATGKVRSVPLTNGDASDAHHAVAGPVGATARWLAALGARETSAQGAKPEPPDREPPPANDSSQPSARIYYFHLQPNGLPEEMSDRDGHLAWRAQYRVWGSAVAEEWQAFDGVGRPVEAPRHETGQRPDNSAAPMPQNLRMQGQYLDRETGLHYNTFRYYGPDVGAFTTPDPIGLAGGVNLHQYAPNPVSWIDPLGWNPVCRMSQTPHETASSLPLVRPGTSAWQKAVEAIRQGGKGDIRVSTAAEAKALLQEARGGMDRRKMYSDDGDYSKGYQVHKPQPGTNRSGDRLSAKERWQRGETDVGNDLPHIKWKDQSGRDQGHIFSRTK